MGEGRSDGSESISIADFLRYALRHLVSIIILAVLGLAGGFAYVQMTPAKYEATASIIVLGNTNQSGVSRDIILGNYTQLITSNVVLGRVEAAQTDLSIDTLRANISATRDKTNEIITITYTSPQSDRAASVVSSIIDSFQEAITEMYDVDDEGVNVLSPAIDSGVPTNKSFTAPVLMGLAAGLGLAFILTSLRFDAWQKKASKLEKMTDEEKRKQRRLERDAETIRRQKVQAELKEIAAREAESEARSKDAQLRIARTDLRRIETKILEAERQLKVAKLEKQTAEQDADRAKTQASTAEIELQSTINEIGIAEEKQIARRQSIARRRTARAEARIKARTEVQAARLRAEKRLEAERASTVTIAPDGTPVISMSKRAVTALNAADNSANRQPLKARATSMLGKRPLGER